MNYAAGYNTPGYSPDPDNVQDFDSFEDAVHYLSETVERFWDEDYETVDGRDEHVTEDEERSNIDARWLDVHTALHNAGTGPEFQSATKDKSLVFWVHAE